MYFLKALDFIVKSGKLEVFVNINWKTITLLKKLFLYQILDFQNIVKLSSLSIKYNSILFQILKKDTNLSFSLKIKYKTQ